MDIIKKVLFNLSFIFRPGFWIMNRPYDKRADQKLNSLMDRHRFKRHPYFPEFFVQIGGENYWVENYPYFSFINARFRGIPSRSTIYKAAEKMKKDLN